MYTKDDIVKELEDIKLKIREVSFDQYIECGEYIGEDTQKWNLAKSDEVFEIINKKICDIKDVSYDHIDKKYQIYMCDTCEKAWTDDCEREKCWLNNYSKYMKEH